MRSTLPSKFLQSAHLVRVRVGVRARVRVRVRVRARARARVRVLAVCALARLLAHDARLEG